MRRMRMLSLGGGGMRGIGIVTILQKIEQMAGKPIYELFDLIAGTSTGALITAVSTIGNGKGGTKYSLNDVANMYITRGKDIFPSHVIENPAKPLFKPHYPSSGIKSVLSDYLGNALLSECIIPIMICSVDADSRDPVFIKWRDVKENNNMGYDVKLVDACMATSAAPTYFPSHIMSYPTTFDGIVNGVDGGLCVNSPSVSTLAEFLKHRLFYIPEMSKDDVIDYNNIFLLSLETGSYSGLIKRNGEINKGIIYWAPNISDIMIHTAGIVADYQMKEFMNDGTYLRLNAKIPIEKYSSLTNSSEENMNYLIKANLQLVNENKLALEQFINNIL